MSQFAPAEPIVTSSDKVADLPDDLAEPSPPLGKLTAAIREYVSAVRLGEDKGRRLDLSRRVWKLCWTCRPKHGEREMRFTDGMLAHVVRDYRTIHVQWKDSTGRVVTTSSSGRHHAGMPSEVDRELDRVRDEMARAEYETAVGKRTKDERARPLPRPATDRLLAIADRIEPQEAGDSSEPTHSADFTSVNWFGTRYVFTKTQAECIKLLWAEWDKGGLTLSEKTIGDEIESSSDRYRLVHTFRSKRGEEHPSWGSMIQAAGKGIFCLCAPNHT